jgi:hypothetical protein
MTLALALGILVADLTNLNTVSTAAAQTTEDTALVGEATVVGERIVAQDVLVNGVPTTAVFVGSVKVVDSVLYSGDVASLSGVNVGDNLMLTGVNVGDNLTLTGVNVGDNLTLTGVNVGDNLTANGVNVGDNSPTIFGGVVEGDDVKVVDGIITGENLTVTGAVVGGSLSSVVVTSSGTQTTPMQ